MNKIKGFLILTAMMAACVFSAHGQSVSNSTMKFDEELWDFGKIREDGGTVEHTFEFTNTGSAAFVIEHIQVSCGCTTPTFTRTPIKPGEKGSITLTYDPMNRPGIFLQDAHIRSNGGQNLNVVKIKGEVVPRTRPDNEAYPFTSNAGKVRFDRLSVNLGYVEPGVPKSMTVAYKNTSSKTVVFGVEKPENKYLTVSAPESICAGCSGDITITYRFPAGVYGRYVDRFHATVDGKRESIPFSSTAIAVDKISGVDENKAPRADFNLTFHNFGSVRNTAHLRRNVTMTNNGRQTLTVRWLGMRDYVTTTLTEGTTVAPGEKITFEVAMDPSGRAPGDMNASLTIIVNDPLRPVREIRLAAKII